MLFSSRSALQHRHPSLSELHAAPEAPPNGSHARVVASRACARLLDLMLPYAALRQPPFESGASARVLAIVLNNSAAVDLCSTSTRALLFFPPDVCSGSLTPSVYRHMHDGRIDPARAFANARNPTPCSKHEHERTSDRVYRAVAARRTNPRRSRCSPALIRAM